MKKKIAIFFSLGAVLMMVVFGGIKSPYFVQKMKFLSSRYFLQEWGIHLDFARVSVRFFPPGLSIQKARVVLKDPASEVHELDFQASRIDLDFKLLALLSGRWRLQALKLVDGNVLLVSSGLFQKKDSGSGLKFQDFLMRFQGWFDLLEAETIVLRLQEGGGETSGVLEHFSWSDSSYQLKMARVQGEALQVWGVPAVERFQIRGKMHLTKLEVESWDADFSHLRVQGSGACDAKTQCEGKFELAGNLEKLGILFPVLAEKFPGNPEGSFQVQGEVQGKLSNFIQTLQVQAKIHLENVRECLGTQHKDQCLRAQWVDAELKYQPSASCPLWISQVLIREPMVVGNERQRGQGGGVKLGPFGLSFPLTQPVSIPIELEHAHLHWLASLALQKIYPLDFRVHGSAGVTYFPKRGRRGWRWGLKLNLALENFALDNQRYEKPWVPKSFIFKIPQIALNGSIQVNASGIQLDQVFINLLQTRLKAFGSIDFQTGYDLHAMGDVALEDFGKIAGFNARGHGPLRVHVHGLSRSVLVDFDTDLQEAFYFDLFLGKVKGKMTWDDGVSNFLIHQVQLKNGVSLAQVDGGFSFGKEEKVSLEIRLLQASISDTVGTLDGLLNTSQWFPKELIGMFEGGLSIHGGLRSDALKIDVRVSGNHWKYAREHFKKVTIVAGYDGGLYFVRSFEAIKRTGRFLGEIRYRPEESIDWKFRSDQVLLRDWDVLAELDVPIRGNMEFESHGKGDWKNLGFESETHWKLKDLNVWGLFIAPSEVHLKTHEGKASLDANLMDGAGSLRADYYLNGNHKNKIHAVLNRFDFSSMLFLLNRKLRKEPQLQAKISADLKLEFEGSRFDEGTGFFAWSEFLLEKKGLRFYLEKPCSAKIQEGSFQMDPVSFRSGADQIVLDLSSKKSILQGSGAGRLDLALFEFFIPSLVQFSGKARWNFAMQGSWSHPEVSSVLTLEGASLLMDFLDASFEKIRGVFLWKDQGFSFQQVEVLLGGGSVILGGKVHFRKWGYPEVSIHSSILNSKFKIYPFQYARLKGNLDFVGDGTFYTLEGNVLLDSALFKEKFNQKVGVEGTKTLSYAPQRQAEAQDAKIRLNVKVALDKGVLIQNDLMRSTQIQGKVQVLNALNAPALLGNLQILRGTLMFKSNAFQIQSGSVTFDSPTAFQPNFDLIASTEINAVKIRMYATGSAQQVKIEFTSNPTLPESDILSLLTTGLTSYDTQRLSANDLGVVQRGEAASLVLHSLDFNRDLEEKTGFQVKLDESLNNRQGTSVFTPLSQADTAAAPQITIRRQLNQRLSLSAGSTVGIGTNKSNQLNMDYLVNKNFSLTSVFTNYGNSGTSDIQSSTQTTENSFGLDLKFQKKFK